MGRIDFDTRRTLLVLIAAASAMQPARAQTGEIKPVRRAAGDWPNKPIRLVVAFPPGGLTDAYARLYAEHLTAKFGVPAVVDNKPGAGAVIGIDAVAKAAPDGYTLLMTTSGTVWQNRVLFSKLPYNLDKDIVPVAVFPSGPLVVGVPEKLGINTYRELVAHARKNDINMGSYAPGSYPQMVADQTNRSEGTKIVTINYKGESPMWIDVASGQIQVAIGSFQAFDTVASRGAKSIGVTGSYRSPQASRCAHAGRARRTRPACAARRRPAADGPPQARPKRFCAR